MEQPEYKVILVGATRVGKSSIIQGLSQGINDGQKRTIQYMTPDAKPYKVIIVDTPCLNQQASAEAKYYENAKAVVFLGSYDLPNSLAELKPDFQNHVNKFLEPNSYLTYFGMCKCDIKGTEKSQVTSDQVKQTAQILGVDHVYDLSIQQHVGVKALFQEIGETLYKKDHQ